MPAVSVIMPVYNAGKYLRGAIDSVLAQTFRDFELLLIDDGATDGSGTVCDEYAAKDARVRVRHGRNGGICASRNVGLSLAQGEWIGFCDHDDAYEPVFLEKLISAVRGTDYALVKANRSTYRREPGARQVQTYAGFRRPSGEWRLDDLLDTAEGYRFYCNGLNAGIWDCLIRRDFLQRHGIRFNESFKCGCEDFDFMLSVFEHVRRGMWIDDLVYRHYLNVGVSTSMRCHLRLLDDYLATALRERRIVGFRMPETVFASFAQWIYLGIRYVMMAPDCPLSLKDQVGWVKRYHAELVGTSPVDGRAAAAFGWKKAFLYACIRLHAIGPYLVIRRIAVGVRRQLGRGAG